MSISSRKSKSAKTGISTPLSSNRTASSATRFACAAKSKSIPRDIATSRYYYIEWWQGGRKREQIKDRVEVVHRARRKAIELDANRAGIETVQEIGNGNGLTVTEAVASYLKDMEPPQREPKTYMAYKYCLELFASLCTKRFIRDVKREDLLAFIRKLYELNCGPRTAYNRAVIVSQLLKANGITDQTVSDPLQPDSKTQTTKIRNEVALRIEEKPPEPGLLINPTLLHSEVIPNSTAAASSIRFRSFARYIR